MSSSETLETVTAPAGLPAISGEHRKVLHEIFRHPLSHNLTWRETVAFVASLGSVEQVSDHVTAFRIGHETHRMHKPHTKDMTTPEILEVRHFLQRAGFSPTS